MHFFDLAIGKYQWLKADQPPLWADKSKLRRNYLPKDLLNESHTELDIQGLVHIEAGFDNDHPERELQWLSSDAFFAESLPVDQRLSDADDLNAVNEFSKDTVGFSSDSNKISIGACPIHTIASLNICQPTDLFKENLSLINIYSTCKGIRHIIDNDLSILSQHPSVIDNLRCLAMHNMIFELQVGRLNRESCNAVLDVFAKLPDLRFVLNHGGFPSLSTDSSDFADWKVSTTRLMTLPNAFIKVSGSEMTDRNYNLEQLRPHIIHLMELSPERIMMASNFPLLLFRYSYHEYWKKVCCLLDSIYPQAKNEFTKKLLYENAKQLYGF